MSPIVMTFTAGRSGQWTIERCMAAVGDGLALADCLDVREAHAGAVPDAAWTLRGTTSNTRYTNRAEVTQLGAKQQGLARPSATRAALIPIRKTQSWWGLAQDERRAILEEESRHIAIGLEYLPAIARKLHHSRELGEPFDFLTWFEYAPEHEADFDHMLVRLRASREWTFVDREVDIRLRRV